MCGIAGILTAPQIWPPEGALDLMTDALAHRGPDARGVFKAPEAGVHLGHRRLSILDLSEAGAQPMTSRSGRITIVFNGEIYNFPHMRAELDQIAKVPWRGTSDTEVMLELIEQLGIEAALRKVEGMYAFAAWNGETGELILARDRFGEKPLFIGHVTEGLIFASELKSIMAFPGFVDAEDEDAISLFLKLSYIPEPLTPFRRVRKVPPGHYALLKPGDREFSTRAYWDAAQSAITARVNSISQRISENDLLQRISDRLLEVVKRQMVADVPIGAFLSGGIDSSLVVALMQMNTTRPVKTFTIGFKDQAYDETSYARAVAKHLGTDHTEVILDWQNALDLVDTLPEIYSEPFADSSQLPTSLVCRVARELVTVCLSGDAGDELFGGYNRHLFARQYQRGRAYLPNLLRRPAGRILKKLAEPGNAQLLDSLLTPFGERRKIRQVSEKLEKLSSALGSTNDLSLYASLIRRDDGLIGGDDLLSYLAPTEARLKNRGHSLAEVFMLLDTLTYLPGDILTKVDRAAMAASLETRVPYLDHQLLDLVWSLPIESRIMGGQTKSVLRKMLAPYVPSELFQRPKAGFGVPIDNWLRGPLFGWIRDHVTGFCKDNSVHANAARDALELFVSKRRHTHHFLWNIAMLQSWRNKFRHARSP